MCSFATNLGGVFAGHTFQIYLTLIRNNQMTENKKFTTVSFFNSRLTSVISIALVLFLLGLILLMGLMGDTLSRFVKENITFSVVLKDDMSEGEVKRMQKKLEAEPFIKSIEYN